jgi:hypothetical protein
MRGGHAGEARRMCMQTTQVRPYHRWNWHGDEIVHDPVVPASRTLPGGRRIRGYRIDVREFLSTEGNAVVGDEVARIVRGLSAAEAALFRSHDRGAFDFRARCVVRAMSRLRYRRRHASGEHRSFDDWLFPEETLALGGGDCEDLSFLLAALLEASGVSADCVRVAFGSIVDHAGGAAARHDHAWVMYQDERGMWEILDPFAAVAHPARRVRSVRTGRALLAAARRVRDVEYAPSFVMNRRHLRRVRGGGDRRTLADALGRRTFWRSFDPSFAADVHDGIIEEALGGGASPLTADEIARVKRESLWVDVNTLAYDPRDHFDFAYLGEGWRRVRKRLASPDLGDFALAVHAIGDFYAHSVYAEFAPRRPDGTIPPYDPATFDAGGLAYDFDPYAPLPGADRPVEACEKLWRGKLVSGQWWRWFSTFPDDLQDRHDFPDHRCLPDHDLLAVDGPNPRKEVAHRYAGVWAEQYALRRTAAVEHVRMACAQWSAGRT